MTFCLTLAILHAVFRLNVAQYNLVDTKTHIISRETNTLLTVPELNVRGQKLCEEERVPDIMEVKQELEDKGWVLIPGIKMKALLLQFGATTEDLNELESGSIHKDLPQDQQTRKYFRKIFCNKMILNTTNKDVFTANSNCITQIPRKEIATSDDIGTRYYLDASHRYRRNTVSTALARMNLVLSPDHHHHQDNLNTDHEVTINEQFVIRTTRTNAAVEVSPTPEGVHQDNTEISSVVLIGRYNITHGGESRLWNLKTPIGNYDEDLYQSGAMDKNLILNHPLKQPFETIYFNDRKMKHEARAVQGNGLLGNKVRDVIVNFIRKPTKDGQDVFLRREKLFHL